MEIVVFQIVIVLSLAISRAISQRSLSIAAVAWSILTLIMVFATPLILLQLFVIWGAHSLFSPKGADLGAAAERKVGGTPDVGSRSAMALNFVSDPSVGRAKPKSPSDVSNAPETGADTSVLNSLIAEYNETAGKLAASLERKRGVLEATREIDRAIHSEKAKIEAALRCAELKVAKEQELQHRGEEFTIHYDDASKKISQILAAHKNETDNALEITMVPDFAVSPHHEDPVIAAAIQERYAALAQERSQRLNTLLDTLSGKPIVQEAFWSKLGHRSKALLLASIDRVPSERLRERQRLSALPLSPSKNPAGHEKGNIIAERAAAREIPYLVHFTRVENIPSIMANGLLSVRELRAAEVSFLGNDQVRWDGHAEACCLSIAHPNEKLFYRWRKQNGETDWVVLVLAPEIMWEADAAYCAHNAADARMSSREINDRRAVDAFEAMFEEHETTPHRDLQGLRPFDPSDVQAEVLAFQKIPPERIIGAAFSDLQALNQYRGRMGARRVRHVNEGEGFFGTRTRARQTGWQF
ncbi:MAG: DarT ssDNA thymidine ADP-ribosyltransferase family protein [Erythrobacter sp.]|nr:DarT ssDNA thymidine ADP-ribosyltransferase family protein [Erythrobacter sp.]